MRSQKTTGENEKRHGTTNRCLIPPILPILPILLILPIILCSPACADQVVIAHATVDPSKFPERLLNPGFEETGGWFGWAQGFEPVDNGGRNGSRGVKCIGTTDSQHGVSQPITLGQDKPRPIIVTGWSRAENVDGSADTGYAIYLDIDYKDGDHLWALTANFSVGTHDWEQRRVTFAPEKKIESLTVHALFRGHNGTVYFDDFSLIEMSDKYTMFEGVLTRPATPAERRFVTAGTAVELLADHGLKLHVDEETGAMASVVLNNAKVGENGPPVFVRDVATDSDFIAPGKSGIVESLGLEITLDIASKGNAVSISGRVEDLRDIDRAITLYVPIPLSYGWTWWQDMRRSQPAKGLCINAFRTGAGATGMRSSYPMAVLTGAKGGIALAAPIDSPQHHRLAYDTDRELLYAAFDLGLAHEPRGAWFHAILFAFDSQWRFRAALDEYYRMFPLAFQKRVPREGLWMAFTDISTIPSPEDFGFAYQEGASNVAWDEQHDILSFPYTEPMTTWLKLAPEVPRTYDGAMGYLIRLLENKDDPLHESASIIDVSSVHDADGRRVVSVVNAPWCDGCVFALNADPKTPVGKPGGLNRGQSELSRLQKAVTNLAPRALKGWPWHGEGNCAPDTEIKYDGAQSLRLEAPAPGKTVEVFQTVDINQHKAEPLVIRGAVRTKDLAGNADTDCSIYVDLVHSDGTPLYCQAIPIEPGTREFEVVEKRIVSDKPFQSATVHLLLRGNHAGTVWFDGLFLGEEENGQGVATPCLLQNAGFEGPVEPGAVADGTYIDSYEFWANTIDYNHEHFSNQDEIPLAFDAQSHRVGMLTMFATFAFQRALTNNMHGCGKLMMANGALGSYDCCAPYLDVLGTETNWMPEGKWQPMTDAELCFRRALCYQKPYCFLMNTHYANFSFELTERYMQRALAYGMYPGFFSENAATDCYWANPKYYEPARPLFKKYIPLIQMIAKAGWQPITYATSDNPKVYVERFGGEKMLRGEKVNTGEAYFTLLNDSDKAATAKVTFDLYALGLRNTTLSVRELITETDMMLEGDGLSLDLKPEQVSLINIDETS